MTDREYENVKELIARLRKARRLLQHVCEKCPGWEVLVDEGKEKEIREELK